MSSAEGGESPPPERQTGAQLNDVPASGHGTDEAPNKKSDLQDQLKGPLDDALEAKFNKTQTPSTEKKA